MVVIAPMMFVIFLIVVTGLLLWLRGWTFNQNRTEDRLRSPETHSLAYTVPEGADPAVVMAALTHAGFASVVDFDRGTERLLVECDEADRERVRGIIEHTGRTGPAERVSGIGHVSFEDEATSA